MEMEKWGGSTEMGGKGEGLFINQDVSTDMMTVIKKERKKIAIRLLNKLAWAEHLSG